MMKKVLIIIAIVIVVLAGGAAGSAYYYLFRQPLVKNEIWVRIAPTTTQTEIYQQMEAGGLSLEELGKIQLVERFYEWKDGRKLEGNHGAYRLENGMSAARVVTRILRHQQTPIKVTFNECRLVSDLAGKIADDLMCDSAAVLNAILSPDFIAECETDRANVISFFFPDTYEVYWDISPEKFVRKMLAEYKKFWTDERQKKAESLKVSPREVSIICSIAEEETQNRTERGVVARLYWNRLQIGMPLQADPTVKFAIGDFALRRILNRHLEIDSPYNTYRVAGLPPGPIRMVEKKTIDAFLNSAPHKYLYMCAKEDFSGTHNFATNLNEHLRNAQRYHAALNRQR